MSFDLFDAIQETLNDADEESWSDAILASKLLGVCVSYFIAEGGSWDEIHEVLKRAECHFKERQQKCAN